MSSARPWPLLWPKDIPLCIDNVYRIMLAMAGDLLAMSYGGAIRHWIRQLKL